MGKNSDKENQKREAIDLAAVRERLAAGKWKETWRSLAELAEAEQFLKFLHEEFPRETSWVDTLNRRDFLKLLAAPLALAGLTACIPQPVEKVMPYVEAPEDVKAGESMFFATSMELNGFARGLIAESYMGRPTKIEGNPLHPASLGATDPFSQASVLDLYDPDRAQVITFEGRIRSWQAFVSDFTQALNAQRTNQGSGLRLLTGTVTSPTLASQISSILEQLPQARWHQYDPINRDNVRAGAELAFGDSVETHYRFDRAAVILSLDSDFLLWEPGNLAYIRQFTGHRRVDDEQPEMNRLYVVESSLSNTGAIADHRLPLQARQVEGFTRHLAQRLGVDTGADTQPYPLPEGWMEALVDDLQNQQGSSLVIVGPQQPPAVHALAHAINQALGNAGQTVFYTDVVEANPLNQADSLVELARDLAAGQVELLIVLEGNPVYTAPADLNFSEQFQKAGLRVYLGRYDDETAFLSNWHIPASHYLEMWGDTRAYDGTISLIQPLIEPLYSSRSPYELLAVFTGQPEASGYDIVRQFWQGQNDQQDFELWWRKSLHDGLIAGSNAAGRPVSLAPDLRSRIASNEAPPAVEENGRGLEIVFLPDPTIWDGRFANNAWLQELPKPITKLVWDNAALISPGTAERLGLQNEDLIDLHYRGRTARAPVWILPGLSQDSVTVHLGFGRRRGGNVLAGVGFNAYALRTIGAPWFDYGLEIRRSTGRYPLASTQDHHSMEGRDLVKVATLQQFRQDPHIFEKAEHTQLPPPSLYPEYTYEGYAWGMSINLNTCIGCNACVVACQAENNIPIVGKDQVLNGREMHWLRIDSYFQGNLDDPSVHFQPVPCMHCEKAPCEPVCPVSATVHSSEGLNEMVYNRCIGTRYCSNNCPYKVRRFNFLQYSENLLPLNLQRNPDVTVRTRGVMEKCTYCVQRINQGRSRAKIEGRPLVDGEVRTACQQACPAEAIVFGDINDPDSHVSQLKEQPHNYALLAHLGTQPRTTYLAKLRNPNPLLEEPG